MSSEFGKNIRISIFGQSHSDGIGVVIDGLPAGEEISLDAVGRFMARRAPGKNRFSTPRKETDTPEILSGIVNGRTCGAPLCAVIRNNDVRSGDYDAIADIPRPSHSDYPAFVKYGGYNDVRGGGHFSGRLTAPLCFAGAVCLQILERRGITIGAHISSISSVKDTAFDPVNITADELISIGEKDFPVINDDKGEMMKSKIDKASTDEDSVGGVVECCILGAPAGLGSPMFAGVENRLAYAVLGIPAVKGIEFGAGFASTKLNGSENNDPYYYDGDEIKTRTNNHGGIIGGITTGMPVIFRTAFKPTPSIRKEQDSVSLSGHEDTKLVINGRHDPCIVQRAVPCVEAAAAAVMLDLLAEFGRF